MYEGGVIAVGKTDSAHTALDGPGVIPSFAVGGRGSFPLPPHDDHCDDGDDHHHR